MRQMFHTKFHEELSFHLLVQHALVQQLPSDSTIKRISYLVQLFREKLYTVLRRQETTVSRHVAIRQYHARVPERSQRILQHPRLTIQPPSGTHPINRNRLRPNPFFATFIYHGNSILAKLNHGSTALLYPDFIPRFQITSR